MKPVQVAIRTIGNSRGVLLPKPMLAQAGLEDSNDAELTVEGDAIVLRKPTPRTRSGWAPAARELAAHREDELLMGEFTNVDDEDLRW
jgi:antitoxin MazE